MRRQEQSPCILSYKSPASKGLLWLPFRNQAFRNLPQGFRRGSAGNKGVLSDCGCHPFDNMRSVDDKNRTSSSSLHTPILNTNCTAGHHTRRECTCCAPTSRTNGSGPSPRCPLPQMQVHDARYWGPNLTSTVGAYYLALRRQEYRQGRGP